METAQVDKIVESIQTEDDAFGVFWALQKKFQWKGTVFTEDDITSTWDGMSEEGDPDITQADIDAVRDSWEWRKGIQEVIGERGMEMLCDVVLNVKGGIQLD